MTLEDILQNLPHDGLFAVDDALGGLDGLHQATLEELADDIGLEELGSHILGQTALVHIQLGADHDDRTARVVDTLTEQVLAEATLLALQGVGERLEGAVGLGLDTGDLAAVVEERVYRLLKHALLVAHNDLRSLDFHQALEAVVADNDAAVELVDVGSGEAATIERNKGTQVGRDDGDDVHNHPLGTVVHTASLHVLLRLTERLNHIEAFEGILLAGHGSFARGLGTELIGKLVEVKVAEKLVERLGTHAGDELVGVGVGELIIAFRQRVFDVVILFFRQQIEFLYRVLVKHSLARLHNDVFFVIDYLIELLRGHIEKSTYFIGKRTEEPDVGNRDHKFDVTHALAAHLFLGNLHTATVADYALVTDALILSAMALPVAGRAEDAFAK